MESDDAFIMDYERYAVAAGTRGVSVAVPGKAVEGFPGSTVLRTLYTLLGGVPGDAWTRTAAVPVMICPGAPTINPGGYPIEIHALNTKNKSTTPAANRPQRDHYLFNSVLYSAMNVNNASYPLSLFAPQRAGRVKRPSECVSFTDSMKMGDKGFAPVTWNTGWLNGRWIDGLTFGGITGNTGKMYYQTYAAPHHFRNNILFVDGHVGSVQRFAIPDIPCEASDYVTSSYTLGLDSGQPSREAYRWNVQRQNVHQ